MRFSIGTDDFKTVRTETGSDGTLCFYCDKSLLIKDIIDDGAKVIVLPRPRRFGKTLNLSMLKYFFDMTEDNAHLFQGLKIWAHQNIMDKWQGKYPVVFISFKDLKRDDYSSFVTGLKKCLYLCYQNFSYLLESARLNDGMKKAISVYFEKDFDLDGIEDSLWYLTKALKEHHGKEAIVLMDEYDTPLQEAYMNHYFDQAIKPFRAMMGKVFKGNEFLYKGVITGITRIAKESLFSGVNNLDVFDITRNKYAQYFGFTEEEVQQVCPPDHLEDLKSWYNGYNFGDHLTIYNPWSVLKFCSNDYKLEPYWINTSTNDLIKDTLTADKLKDVKTLIEGGSIPVEIEPFTVMDNLKTNPSSFWNLLFMSGLLTLNANKDLRIPNQEIRYFFEKIVMDWFGKARGSQLLVDFLGALIAGEVEKVQAYLSIIILESLSFHDVNVLTQESFYHGFLLGITLGLKGRYIVDSNRESGFGRYDIALYPNNPQKDPGIVIEVKFKQSTKQALNQIKEQNYKQALELHGCQKILSYGFAFDGKDAAVALL